MSTANGHPEQNLARTDGYSVALFGHYLTTQVHPNAMRSAWEAFKTEDAMYEGDGAGKPTGILGHTGTVSVAKEGGQAAATIEYKNILKMWGRMRNRSNSVWMLRP